MHYNFNLGIKTTKKKIKEFGSKNSRKMLLMQVEHVQLRIIKQQIKILNKEFKNKKRGRPAYHRGMILVLALFCKSKHIHSYEKMAAECEDNIVLLKFTEGKTPGEDVFRRFFKNTDKMIFKKILYGGLARFNNCQYLSFDRVFLDSTDAVVSASLNYTINKKQIQALRQLKKWKILHNDDRISINQFIKNLKKKKEEYQNNPEILKLINVALRKPKIYTTKNYNNIPLFLKAMEENSVDSVPISFPESRIMRTKRGRYDTAFNLQILMLERHIALAGYLHSDANDSDSIRKIFTELKEDLELLISITREFGEYKDNLPEIENLLKNIKIICDSGYHSLKNIKAAIDLELTLIFMTKQISRQNNNAHRKSLREILAGIKKDKIIDFTRKDCIRVDNGYNCPFERPVKLIKVRMINSKVNENQDLRADLLQFEFTHSCINCSDCPYVERYGKKCSCATIVDKTTPYEYFQTNAFVNGEFDEDYKDRFHIAERVNAFLKGTEGMLYLTGRDLQGVENEQLLMLSIQNYTIFRGLIESET